MPIPITVITGFLGSGKTTLLQYILSANHGKKILVVQNEFSDEMGIESPQLVNDQGQVIPDLYELPNGCMCCSVRDSFIGTLEAIFSDKPDRFDYVVVETAGLADPENVIGLFWMDSELGSDLRLDGVIAVVDAYNISKYLSLTQRQVEHVVSNLPQMNRLALTRDNDYTIANIEAFRSSQHVVDAAECRLAATPKGSNKPASLALAAVKQIATANVILLNKVDLVTRSSSSRVRPSAPSTLESIESTLHLINPLATILQCEKGKVPLNQLLDLNAFAINPSNVIRWFLETGTESDGHVLPMACCRSSVPCSHRGCTRENSMGELDNIVTSSLITFQTSFLLQSASPLVSWSSPFPSSSELASLLASHSWVVSRSSSIWTESQVNSIFGSFVWKCDDDASNESDHYGDIFRYKGLFLVADDHNSDSSVASIRLAALQGVGEVFEIQPVEKSLSCIEKLLEINGMRFKAEESCFEFTNKFLFVGNHVNVELIKERLARTTPDS